MGPPSTASSVARGLKPHVKGLPKNIYCQYTFCRRTKVKLRMPKHPIARRMEPSDVRCNLSERVIDVREIKPHIRHTIIFQLFEHLGQQSSLQVISDPDPKKEGPDIWRVRPQRAQGSAPP
jgi:hypothetical protein